MGETEVRTNERKKTESESSTSSSSSSSSASSSEFSLVLSVSPYSLPPSPDGGWGWMVVFSAFMTMLISDGFAFSFGVLYAELLEVFGESKSDTSWIASLFYGVPLICGPVSGALATRYGCRKIQIIGGLIAFAGVFASSFATSVWMLCFTLGTVAGIGMSMGYVTSMVMVAFYFEKKRALATGLAVCGSGIGTFLFAPLIEFLIEKYTWRGSFVILSGITLNLVVCGCFYRPLRLSPQQKWQKKLEIFERLSKTISRSISRTSISDILIRSRHTSHTDDGDSSSENENEAAIVSHSHIQLPTYLNDESKDTMVEIEPNGAWSHHIIKVKRSRSSAVSPSLESTNDVKPLARTSLANTEDTSSALPCGKQLKTAYKTNNSKQRAQDNYLAKPLYRKDLFYRGNLMKLATYQTKSSSCPELHHTSIGEESSSDEESEDECCKVPRCKLSRKKKRELRRLFDLSVFRHPVFILFLVSNFVLYFWYDVPYVFMVDRAHELGISDPSFMISVLGIVNTIGQIVYGIIGDRDIDLYLFYGLSIGLSGVSVLLVPLFTDYSLLCVLSGLYGCFISANYALTTVILAEIVGMDKLTTAYSITLLVQGIGNMVGPPVAGEFLI